MDLLSVESLDLVISANETSVYFWKSNLISPANIFQTYESISAISLNELNMSLYIFSPRLDILDLKMNAWDTTRNFEIYLKSMTHFDLNKRIKIQALPGGGVIFYQEGVKYVYFNFNKYMETAIWAPIEPGTNLFHFEFQNKIFYQVAGNKVYFANEFAKDNQYLFDTVELKKGILQAFQAKKNLLYILSSDGLVEYDLNTWPVTVESARCSFLCNISGCKTCSPSLNCLRCHQNYFLNQGLCVEKCSGKPLSFVSTLI